MSKTTTKRTEIFNGLFLILLGIWIWWYTSSFPSLDDDYPGPSLFPRIIAIGFFLCGIFLFFAFAKLGNQAESSKGINFRRLLILTVGMILIFLFPLITTQLNFIVALGLICFAFGLLLDVMWWKAGLTALMTSLFIYLVFIQLLGVSL